MIPFLKVQVFKFLGFNHNWDKLDFTKFHFDEKVRVFAGLSHVLYNQLIIGAGLALSAQHSYFCGKIRAAAIYGIKIIAFNDAMWKQLDVMQNKFLRRMLATNITTNTATLRVILGILPLSTFVAKLKLLFYHDALRVPGNRWHAVIRANYLEYFELLRANGYNQVGIKGQYRFPTRDFVTTLDFLGMDRRFADIRDIPLDKKRWRSMIEKRIKIRFDADLVSFKNKDGWLLNQLTANQQCNTRRSGVYQGLLDNLGWLLDTVSPSSSDLKPFATILLDSTCLSWHSANSSSSSESLEPGPVRAAQRLFDSLSCIFCGQRRRGAYNVHLLYDCTHFAQRRPATMRQGLNINMNAQERTDWRTFATHLQKHVAKRRSK